MKFGNLGGKPVERGPEPAPGPPPAAGAGAPLPLFAAPGMRPPSVPEIMATALARALHDGEVVVFGAVSLLPLAAARLAQLTHAPNLTILAGASSAVNPEGRPLLPSSGDYGHLAAEALLSFHELVLLQAGGRCDVFFAGGLEIDTHGNANLRGNAAVRGPGAAGHVLATSTRRTLLYTARHDARTFVPHVAAVTLPGWDRGTGRRGPALVVTPLAVLDFVDGQMRLVSTHGGADAAAVQAATGFPLALPPEGVVPTPPPTPEELRVLRALDEGAQLQPPPPA